MDEMLKTPLESWHFFAFMALIAVLGVSFHVARALFNPLPDRLSDCETMDMVISSGYDWNDRLFGTEYDDAGYYRLDSAKNLRLSVMWSMVGGGVAYLITDVEMAHLFAWAANNTAAWFWDLLVFRFQNL